MTWFKLGSPADADRQLIGGKAFSINAMLNQGLPVPPAFVIGTDDCRRFYAEDERLSVDVHRALCEGIAHIESQVGRTFGGSSRPLLVSVRSGAPQSMPGMMDTVLNLGITDRIAATIGRETGDELYAQDTLCRFREQFQKVVGAQAPDDPWSQLDQAVAAVFGSWNSPRAIKYRSYHGLSHDGGTAVTVQAMVFGNADDHSGTGVLFTRSPVEPSTEPLGEWILRGQGEDIVSGRMTPQPLAALAARMPSVHEELMTAAASLEKSFADVQEIEFTIESGRLWLLQTRSAKRSARAAVHHAVSFAREGLITPAEALSRLSPEQVRLALAPRLATAATGRVVLARGEVGCPGLASGMAVGAADEAEDMAAEGINVILLRPTTDPDDVHGMLAAKAVVTEIGGSTSHAAVVSREFDRPCIVGCGPGALMHLVGREITIDATAGEVLDGVLPVETPSAATDPDLSMLRDWLTQDDFRGHPLGNVVLTAT